MKRMMRRLLPVLMAVAPLTVCAQKVYELKDASGRVQVNVSVMIRMLNTLFSTKGM